jgi:Isochorismatase family
VYLMGINTNTCVLNKAFTAFNHDYRIVVLSDCVASMYGDDLHAVGLQNVARCLGWALGNEQFRERVENATGKSCCGGTLTCAEPLIWKGTEPLRDYHVAPFSQKPLPPDELQHRLKLWTLPRAGP